MFTFCCRFDVSSFWSVSKTAPLCDFLFGGTLRLKRLSIPMFFSHIARDVSCICLLFTALVYCSRANESPRNKPLVFPLGLPVLKTDALVVSILKQLLPFLRTCCSNSSVMLRQEKVHIQNMCVQAFAYSYHDLHFRVSCRMRRFFGPNKILILLDTSGKQY